MYTNVKTMMLLSRLAEMGFEDHREAVKRRRGDHHVAHKENGKPKPHPRSGIDAIVIHATDAIRSQTRPTSRFEGINAHFVVLKRGKVLYLHDMEEYLNASHAFNRRSIAIEHELRPPDHSKESLEEVGHGKDLPTREQILSSRLLLRTLTKALPQIRFIYGHKQSANKLCPGPHLWYNVVRWAEENLGLTCGGRDYTESNAFGTGHAIPAEWYSPKFDLMGEAAIASALAQINADFPPP